MRRTSIDTAEGLNLVLQERPVWANGKNFAVDHLHATVAESRWPYENIHGIYVTNEEHAWMAMWMAVSNRESLRKRHLRYIFPEPGDNLGRLEVFSASDRESCLSNEGYLYLFNPTTYLSTGRILDISSVPKKQKVEALLDAGFEWGNVQRHGNLQAALLDKDSEPGVVVIDEWQVVLTNTSPIVPDREIVIERPAIEQLLGLIALSDKEVGEDYIVRKES